MVLMPHSRERGVILARVAELATRYPNVNVIFDHMEFPAPNPEAENFGFYPEHLEECASPANVYYEYANQLIGQLNNGGVELKPFVEFAADAFGTGKMIWGGNF